jgi:dethiobiotin synthetase
LYWNIRPGITIKNLSGIKRNEITGLLYFLFLLNLLLNKLLIFPDVYIIPKPSILVKTIFITGIGTEIGKTVVAAIVAEALQADYWKPVQAGYAPATDAQWIQNVLSNTISKVHPELYKLKLAASPHIAAREEGIRINLGEIKSRLTLIQSEIKSANPILIIEGAGGLMAPLNNTEFAADLIRQLNSKVILVSRNYLGSINHSLLTAEVCKYYKLDVAGWIFNDQYLSYEDEIVHWSGFPKLAAIPFAHQPDKNFILQQAALIKQDLEKML